MARLNAPNPYGSLVAVPAPKKPAPKASPAKAPKPQPAPATKGRAATASRPLKPVRLNLDISPALHARLVKRAHRRETSVSALVRSMIEVEVEDG